MGKASDQPARVARAHADSEDYNTLALSASAQIAFILYSEAGLSTLGKQPFRIEGNGLELSAATDDSGQFEHGPVKAGVYRLYVEEAVFMIPAMAEGHAPHPVHVPHDMRPEMYEGWTGDYPDAWPDELPDEAAVEPWGGEPEGEGPQTEGWPTAA